MRDNGSGPVTYKVLWVTMTALLFSMSVGVATMFTWHKESPHSGVITVERWEEIKLHLDYRFDQVESKLSRLENAG